MDVEILAEGDLMQRSASMLTGAYFRTYQTPNASPDIENTPEPCPVFAFLLFHRVSQHDSTLSRPQDTRTDAEPRTSEDVEPGNMVVNRNEKTDCIETISDSTKGKRNSKSNSVDDGAGEESENGEGAVQRCVLRAFISSYYDELVCTV